MRAGPVFLALFGLLIYLFFPVAAVQWVGVFVIVIVLASFAYARTIREYLRVSRKTREIKAHCYQTVDIRIVVQNRSILPLPYMSVVDQPGNLRITGPSKSLLGLGGRKQRVFSFGAKGYQRGAYRVGPIKIAFSDPLGFFPMSLVIQSFVDVVIYPPVHNVLLSYKRGLPAGNIRVSNPIYEDKTRYRSVREYIPGDDLRQINWKVSARTGKLHSTEHLATIYFPTLLLVNLSAADFSTKKRFQHVERTIEAAASVVAHMVRLGQSIGMYTNGRIKDSGEVPSFAIRPGHTHSVHIMEALARIELNDKATDVIEELFRHGKPAFGTRLMYLGPELSDEQLIRLTTQVGVGAHVEFYFLDEQVSSERDLSLTRFEQRTITEYGEDVIAEV